MPFTVTGNAQSEISEKRSRFIGNVFKINSEAEAKELINSVKREHRDAKHNVFAYILPDGACKFSDDGEPSGTAGVPISDILKNKDLRGCLIVVTRYFGGILLGTGGLVRAYSLAAQEALEKITVAELVPVTYIKTTCDYGFHPKLKSFVERSGGITFKEDFSDKIEYTFFVESTKYENLVKNLTDFSGGKLEFIKICEKLHEITKK